MFYSRSTSGFYATSVHGAGVPDDAVEISDELYRRLMVEQSAGKRITTDINGYPIASDPEIEPAAQVLKRALVAIKQERAPILNALAGIGFDAIDANDAATQAAVAQARADLKAITDLPELLAATTYDEMKAAIMARYREIAAAAPTNVQTAFREIFAS